MTAGYSQRTQDLMAAVENAITTDQALPAQDALVFDLAAVVPAAHREAAALPTTEATSPIQHALPRPDSNQDVATALRAMADLLESPDLPLAARYTHQRVLHFWWCPELAEARRIGMYARFFGALVRERPNPDAGVLVVEMVFGSLVLQAMTPLAGYLADTGE